MDHVQPHPPSLPDLLTHGLSHPNFHLPWRFCTRGRPGRPPQACGIQDTAPSEKGKSVAALSSNANARQDSLRTTPSSSPEPVFLQHVADQTVDRPSLYHSHHMISPLFDRELMEASSIMERGRPVKRKESVPPPVTTPLETSPKVETDEYATLPMGLQPMQAALILPDSEKQKLRKQATSQAERFEILGYQEVSGLSKVRTYDVFQDFR
jgi:hypothetical protein